MILPPFLTSPCKKPQALRSVLHRLSFLHVWVQVRPRPHQPRPPAPVSLLISLCLISTYFNTPFVPARVGFFQHKSDHILLLLKTLWSSSYRREIQVVVFVFVVFCFLLKIMLQRPSKICSQNRIQSNSSKTEVRSCRSFALGALFALGFPQSHSQSLYNG